MQPRPVHDETGHTRQFRERLQHEQAALRQEFESTANTAELLKKHSRQVDALLRELWSESGLGDAACLVAVGGYGRGELYPYSDVDLLILLPDDSPAEVNRQVELLIGVFWDIGLAVGHSVRTVSECVEEEFVEVEEAATE